MLSYTEENYLKALLRITLDHESEEVGTNELALQLDVKPATVSDMLKKLKEKQLIDYQKYGKITLTTNGRKHAMEVLRKHRLWETFLYEKLDFTWDEVHEVAEQLEHIQSLKLVNKLDKFLNFPEFDPHGDPIPNENGEMKIHFKKNLSEINTGSMCKMVAVKDNSSTFLKYVEEVGLHINKTIKVISIQEYDAMMQIEINNKIISVSHQFTENILVICTDCDLSKICTKKCAI